VGALPANGQTALMTQTAISPKVNQSLDVHSNLLAEFTFNSMFTLNDVTKTGDLDLGEILNPNLGFNLCTGKNQAGSVPTNPKNISKRNVNALVAWKVHALNTSHLVLS
jgi:hypothetical protein